MSNPTEHNRGVEHPTNSISDDKPITVVGMQQQFAEQAQKLKVQTLTFPSHDQIFKDLLEKISTLDFRKRAELPLADEETKLKTRHYLVIITEELLALSLKYKWGLCRREAHFYTYNGAYWKAIDKDDLKAFLRQAAEKMGVEKFMARYVGFVNQLFEQFYETAYLQAPAPAHDIVKINLINGTFEISTQKQQLCKPKAADFLTYQLPFAYDSGAKAPLFEKFLGCVQPDEACQQLLAEYIGYVFVSRTKLNLEKILLLYGSGANGKSVFFEIITALLGSDNVSHYSLSSLTNEPAYCRAHLATKLVNYASEINGKLEANIFKQLASGEPIEARLPYGQPFTLKNYAKLIFNCNELPTDVEHTHAYFRRFLIVPFSVTIPEAEQDKQLADKIITSELSGVFNWVLGGLGRLMAQGRFTEPDVVHRQLENYKLQSDSVRLFLDEGQFQSHPECYIHLKELYRDYRVYCLEDGLHPVKKPNFQKRLNAIGIQTERKNTGNAVFVQKRPISD